MRYRLPLVVPEHPWDGRATRPPLANVAAKSTNGMSVPSCGSPTRLGLWQLRPNYPLGALTKERMCSDTVHGARPSPPSGRRTIPIGAIRPAPRGRFESAEQSCLPLGPVRLSIGTDAAVPRTHDIPSVPCSRAFATTGALPTISCPLPAPLGTPGHQALESAESTASRRCPVAFERRHSRKLVRAPWRARSVSTSSHELRRGAFTQPR